MICGFSVVMQSGFCLFRSIPLSVKMTLSANRSDSMMDKCHILWFLLYRITRVIAVIMLDMFVDFSYLGRKTQTEGGAFQQEHYTQ